MTESVLNKKSLTRLETFAVMLIFIVAWEAAVPRHRIVRGGARLGPNRRLDQSGLSSRGLPGHTVRTSGPTLPASARPKPMRPFAGGTPAEKVFWSSTSWTPYLPRDQVSTKTG